MLAGKHLTGKNLAENGVLAAKIYKKAINTIMYEKFRSRDAIQIARKRLLPEESVFTRTDPVECRQLTMST